MDITSYIKSKLDEFRNTVTTGYNKVADALPLVPNTSQIQSFVSNPVQYVSNPKYNNGNNLYSTSPFQVSSAVQQAFNSPQVKAFGSLISPQRGINDISQGFQGVNQQMIQPTLNLVKQGVPSAVKMGVQTFPGARGAIDTLNQFGVKTPDILNQAPRGVDLLNIAGLAGATKIVPNMIGGYLGAGFKAGENALSKQPLTQGLGDAYNQGFQFSAQLGPVEKFTSWVAAPILSKLKLVSPILDKVVTKLTPGEVTGFKSWISESLKQGNKSGLSMSVFGALQDAKNPEEALKNVWDQYKMGFAFGGGSKAFETAIPGLVKPALKLGGQTGDLYKNGLYGNGESGMVGNSRSIHPEDYKLYDQANTIIHEKGKFSPAEIAKATNDLRVLGEKYLPVSDQPANGNPVLLANRLTARMAKDALATPGNVGSVNLNAKVDTGIFKSPYERGDIGKIQAELENMLGVPSDAGFKQKQSILGQNYAILQQAADAGAPGAPEAVARAKELFSAIELAQKGKAVGIEAKINEPIGQIDRTKLTGRQLDMTNEQLLKGRKGVAQPETQAGAPKTQTVDPFLAELDAAAAKRDAMPATFSPSETAKQQRQMIQEEMKRPYVDKKYSKNVPDYASSDAPGVAGKAEFNASDPQGGFMDHFKRWIGKREAAKTRATQAVQPIVSIPKEISWDVVRAVEEPGFKTTPEVKSYATKIRSMYDSLIAQAQKSGVDVEYLKNYITHQWKESPEQIQQMLGASQKFKFSLERQIPTYQEGIAMGLTPKYTTPAQIMEAYVTKLVQTKANLDFFTALKRNGIVVDASIGSRTNGFKPIDAAGFPKSRSSMDGTLVEGQYYAPAKVADTINRVFNPQEAPVALQKAADISSGMQNVLMSGGAPKTPLNSWSVAQATKEFMAGRIKKPVVSFIRSFSGDASNKFFADNAGQIIKMQERNIPVSSSWNATDLIDKSSLEKHLGKDFSSAFEKLTGEATFKRFMPQLQISFFNDAEASLLKKGHSATEAADIAAQAVKNFYGVKPSDVRALSNPTAEAAKTALAFAPQYRESMLNFWINNIKSVVPVSIERSAEGMKFKLNNPLSPQNASNTKFMIGSLLALAGMDQANRALNDGRSMWNNPKGDEDKLFVPVSKITGNAEDKTVIKIPWLSSLAFLPRTGVKMLKAAANLDFAQVGREAKGFLSTPLRPLADVGTNQDYFGNNIYEDNAAVGDKAKSIGGYLLKEYGLQHPYAKTAYDAATGKIGSVAQGLTQATELPVRFTTTDKVNSQYYFQNKDQALSGLNAGERKAFDSLPKYDVNNPSSYDKEDSRLRYAIFANNPKVFEAKKAIELASAKQNGTPLDPIYLLSGDEARAVFTFYQASPGSQERRDLKTQYPIINSFLDARTKYFNDKDMQAIQDQYSKGQITQEQASAATQALNDKIASFASGGSKKPKKIASSRVRKVRFSKAKVKIGKFKMFKFPKLAKLKKYKVKKLTARA